MQPLPKNRNYELLLMLSRLIFCLSGCLFFFPSQSSFGQALLADGSLSYENGCLSVQYTPQMVFPDDLNNLIRLGVSVYLGSEFRLEKKRSLWFDEQIMDKFQEWKISYHAITDKYYLTHGSVSLFFSSLDDLLGHLNHANTWQVSCSLHLVESAQYYGMMRLFVVTDKLPPVFQIGSGGYIRWQSDSGWLRWDLSSDSSGFRVNAL